MPTACIYSHNSAVTNRKSSTSVKPILLAHRFWHAGLMTLTAAKAFGATKIVVTDVNSHNLALAEKMGATKTYLPSKTASPQEVADKLKEMLVPVGPQIVFDCVGFESTV